STSKSWCNETISPWPRPKRCSAGSPAASRISLQPRRLRTARTSTRVGTRRSPESRVEYSRCQKKAAFAAAFLRRLPETALLNRRGGRRPGRGLGRRAAFALCALQPERRAVRDAEDERREPVVVACGVANDLPHR